MSEHDDNEWWDGLSSDRKAQIRRWLTGGVPVELPAIPGQQELPLRQEQGTKIVDIKPRGGVV